MKKRLLIFLLLTFSLTVAYSQVIDREKGQLLVMLRADVDLTKNPMLIAGLNSFGIRVDKQLNSFNAWLFTFDESIQIPDKVLQLIRKHPAILLAQFNHKVTDRENIPNDISFTNQWALKNTGQMGGTVAADIHATEAWEITTSGVSALGDTIVIAVIDNGIDLNHEDLNLWKNYNEIPGNLIDDDDNGYVDDFDGWNAYTNSGVVQSGDHGTHVSGIAAAKTNNKAGIAGVSYNAKILPIAGSGSNEAHVVASYGYAFKMRKLYNETNGTKGAFIVATNSSFGIDGQDVNNFPLWKAIYDSLGKVGILNVASTANKGWDVDIEGDIPTSMTNESLITVTNTTNIDTKNTNAAWGSKSIDLGAPGTAIYSTKQGNLYGLRTGTSMAAPMVSGAIALMYAASDVTTLALSRQSPSLLPMKLKRYLIATIDSIPSLVGTTVSGGRLNLFKATAMAANPPFISVFPASLNIILPPNQLDTVVIKLSTTSQVNNLYSLINPVKSVWIKADTTSGSITPLKGNELDLIISTDKMIEGTYLASIIIEDFFYNKLEIPVSLTVDQEVNTVDHVFKPQVKISPNPFRETLNIDFNLPNASHVKVQVYNIQGFIINTLIDQDLSSGFHNLKWEGDNFNNQKVTSGVYFISMLNNSGKVIMKAVKTK